MSIVKFYEIKEEPVKGAHFLVKQLVNKRKNVDYVAVTLFDGQTSQSVNFFKGGGLYVPMLEEMGIVEDSIIETDIKKAGDYYNVENWKLYTDSSITRADFIHMAPIDPEETYDRIIEEVKKVDSNPEEIGSYKSLSFLTIKILDSNKETFKRSSAAEKMHHNFLSGLIYHTYRMLLQALRLCEVYDYVDKELLVCGTVLHDIGKIISLETDDIGWADTTPAGRLLDHALVGVMMIQEENLKNNYDQEKIMMLQHMIASHHGKKEWDAITPPAFPEAELLHHIDMIDSRMNMYEETYKGMDPGTLSSDRVYGLEKSYIYKPYV